MTATKEEASMKYGDNAAIRIDRKKLEIFLITRRRVGEKWNRLIIIRRTMAERNCRNWEMCLNGF